MIITKIKKSEEKKDKFKRKWTRKILSMKRKSKPIFI